MRMPIGRSPSTMTTEPFLRSAIRCDTSAMLSEDWPVIAGELITSATVRTVRDAGMRPPYRPVERAANTARTAADQTTFT